MKLTESEKEKLRFEEIFREEVKKDLINNKKKKISFWKFMNSSFTIFFLSTIVVGGLSILHKDWRNNQQERISDQKRLEIENRTLTKLSEETIARLNVIIELADTIPEYKSVNVLIAYWGNSIRDDKRLAIKYYHLRPLFVKYEKWTLIELLTELERYSDTIVSSKILITKSILLEQPEDIRRGELVYSKTKNGEILPPGRLLKPKQPAFENWKYLTNQNKVIELSKIKNGEILPPGRLLKPKKSKYVYWTYVTNQDKVIKLSESKTPITRFYTTTENQKKLLNSFRELKLSLTKNKAR